MNRTELENELDRKDKQVAKLKKEIAFLLRQQKEFKTIADKEGSKTAVWRQKAIKLEDENTRIKYKYKLNTSNE